MVMRFLNSESKLPNSRIDFNAIAQLIEELNKNHNLTPILGAELEFYLSKEIDVGAWSRELGFQIKPEKGKYQYEFDVGPTDNVYGFIDSIREAKNLVVKYAIQQKTQANFLPKPFANDYGSAMHIHLNFLEDKDVEKYANILCNFAMESINYFIPQKKDLKRLDHRFMAPTHICWGGNNRTCLIRIPDSRPKRIEHRLASSDVDPYLPVYAIFCTVLRGLDKPEQISKFPKIHGNAFDSQYKLKPIS